MNSTATPDVACIRVNHWAGIPDDGPEKVFCKLRTPNHCAGVTMLNVGAVLGKFPAKPLTDVNGIWPAGTPSEMCEGSGFRR